MLECPEVEAGTASVRTSFICIGKIDDIMSLNKCFLTQVVKRTESPLWRMIELSVLGIVGVPLSLFFFFCCCFCVLLATRVTPSCHTSDLV